MRIYLHVIVSYEYMHTCECICIHTSCEPLQFRVYFANEPYKNIRYYYVPTKTEPYKHIQYYYVLVGLVSEIDSELKGLTTCVYAYTFTCVHIHSHAIESYGLFL